MILIETSVLQSSAVVAQGGKDRTVLQPLHGRRFETNIVRKGTDTKDGAEVGSLIIRERRLTDTTVTLEVLGKRLGISKERVRQIEHQALGKLRKALVSIVGDPEDTGLIPVS